MADVIKTKMQTEPAKYNKGVIQAARDIVATEGAGFLLAGLGNLPCFYYHYYDIVNTGLSRKTNTYYLMQVPRW